MALLLTEDDRVERLRTASHRVGGNSALGRLLGYKTGAFVGQMLSGDKAITEKTIKKLIENPEVADLFSYSAHSGFDLAANADRIDLTNNPDYPAIRRVRFKLSAGASGFAIEYQDDDDTPMVFGSAWFLKRNLNPRRLFAVNVANGSMEPVLYDGDVVVVNTESTEPRDGIAFAVNYEGEIIIKRMVRDAGEWWLSSDNPDQRRYPRKLCGEGVFLIGEIIHRQSQRI